MADEKQGPQGAKSVKLLEFIRPHRQNSLRNRYFREERSVYIEIMVVLQISIR